MDKKPHTGSMPCITCTRKDSCARRALQALPRGAGKIPTARLSVGHVWNPIDPTTLCAFRHARSRTHCACPCRCAPAAGELALPDGVEDLWNIFGNSAGTPTGGLGDLMHGVSGDVYDLVNSIIKAEDH